MNKKGFSSLSDEDKELLKLIHQSNLTIDDIRWLKNKKRFKRFLTNFSKEIQKVDGVTKKESKREVKYNSDDEEILDFTKTISMPSKEVIEIFEFAKDLNIDDSTNFKDVVNKIKKKLKREQLIWSFVLIICIIIFSSIGFYLISWQLENNETKNMVQKVQDTAKKKITTTTNQDEDEPIFDSNINFQELLKINDETKGWIKVNGTNIDYPFVQSNDNLYYLTHTFDKSYNKKGWVFLDYRVDINNLSSNNILYAHGLLNKVMFGTLKNVIDSSWYSDKKNHEILITTPDGYYLWQVFSTYIIEPENYYITTNFSNKKDFSKFIDTIKSRSVYDYNVDVSNKDKILTLSSCYDNSKRVVLHAKLIKQK